MKSIKSAGFSLIEVLLAIAILGGTILCLLGVFAPALMKGKAIETIRGLGDIEGKINAFIQSRSFDEVFLSARENQSFYFYKDSEGVQKVTKDISAIDRGSIIKVTLSAADGINIATVRPEDYAKSYLPVSVEIYALRGKIEDRKKQKRIASFTRIKNR